MLIMRVSDPTFDERRPDNRVVVRFQVNQQPDQTWIQTFKGHAASSVLRACANLGLRSWGGAERNAVAPVRGGLLGIVRLGRRVL